MTSHFEISDEAVEAAARAIALDRSSVDWMSAEEWDGILPDRYKETYRSKARAALKAAAPFIAAQAWDEGHDHCFHVENPDRKDHNPYRSIE